MIALLSIAIAVGVGLIVHFAENRKIECTFPDGFNSGGGNIQAQSGGEQQPMGLTSGKTVTTAGRVAGSRKYVYFTLYAGFKSHQCFHFFFLVFIVSYFHMYPLSIIGK